MREAAGTSASSSCLGCCLCIDSGGLAAGLCDKRDDFNFPIVSFPFLSSNIPSAPACGVSQLIHCAGACSGCRDFMERGKVLTQKLLSQGYQKTKLVATLKKFYGRHHDLVNPCGVAVSGVVSGVFAGGAPWVGFPGPGRALLPVFPSFGPVGVVGEACLPGGACCPRAPGCTLLFWGPCLLV